jgi:hypothetical protein
MILLHRTEDRQPIAEIPAETWIWDDVNGEPALFHGWHERISQRGYYLATWLTEGLGDFYLWDTDGSGRPVVLEVLKAVETP